MERVMGIEPTWSAWKAEVLPLNYTRIILSPKLSLKPNFIVKLLQSFVSGHLQLYLIKIKKSSTFS